MRIAIGTVVHEANSFALNVTGRADFEAKQLARGAEMLADWRTKRVGVSGAMAVLSEMPGCIVLPTVAAKAQPGGEIDGGFFHELLNELLGAIEASFPLDGVLLVLHGAMMAEGIPDATGEVLARVRALVGPEVPVVGTLDLHANVTERMVREATALVGYHTAPHVDAFETGERAAQILVGTVEGRLTPAMGLVRLPMIVPPENSTHERGPLAAVIGPALALERNGTILHGSVYPVQPWLDTADVASSVLVVTDGDREEAVLHATCLAEIFWAQRERFSFELVAPDEAVRRALAREQGMVVFCDSADSTSSGSTGDSTAILSALLRAAPIEETALVNVVDIPAVERAIAAGIGATVTVTVGGTRSPEYFQPVSLTGHVKTISDGVFRFKGPANHGTIYRMGRTVVLTQGGIHLVVMERAVSQWDPELYRSVGLEPRDARIVQAKSPMAFRAAYSELCEEVFIIDAPGAASPHLTQLPWKRIGRPIYPLDPDIRWPSA